MKRYLVSVDIIRKGYDATVSARFKGRLDFISNEHGVIFDWNVKFKSIYLDLHFTPSWGKTQPLLFRFREALLKELGLKQSPRPNENSNDLLELSEKQVEIANAFFNNREKYNSTLKMIVGVIKGNNPRGEAKKPESAEMVIDSQILPPNFVILFDDLCSNYKDNFVSYAIFAEEKTMLEYVKLNPVVDKAFQFMQKSKSKNEFSIYLTGIQEYFKRYNEYITQAEKEAMKARNEFNKQIDKVIDKFPFGLESKDQFQKAHIYEYHLLRDEIVEALRENREYKKFLDAIKDPNNFLPLPEEIHRRFDNEDFTYTTDGKIWPLTEKGKDYINKYMESKFKEIPQWFLKDRIKYIEKRNENINFVD